MSTFRILFRDYAPLELEADKYTTDGENAVFKAKQADVDATVAFVPLHNVLAIVSVQTTSECVGAVV